MSHTPLFLSSVSLFFVFALTMADNDDNKDGQFQDLRTQVDGLAADILIAIPHQRRCTRTVDSHHHRQRQLQQFGEYRAGREVVITHS